MLRNKWLVPQAILAVLCICPSLMANADAEASSGEAGIEDTGTCFARGSQRGDTSRIVVNGRCFETVDGDPFFPVADTAWLLVRLSNEDIAHYIQTRSRQGFNVIKFGPESDVVDFEQLSFIFDTLEAHHMYAELYVPGYDYTTETLLDDNYAIGMKLASALAERDNLFAYSIEGMDSPHGKGNPGDMLGRLLETHRAIREADPDRLITFHPRSGHSLVDNSGVDPALMDFYSVHRCSPGSILPLLMADITRTPQKPVFLTEPVYEGRGAMCGCNAGCSADQIFEQIMEAIEAGAAGISYGHYSIWSFNLGEDGSWGVDPSPHGTPWRDALHAEGAQRIAQLFAH